MPYDAWGNSVEPKPSRILVYCKDLEQAVQLQKIFSSATYVTVYPGMAMADTLFDMGLVLFEPLTSAAQRWFHEVFKPHLRPGADIVFTAA